MIYSAVGFSTSFLFRALSFLLSISQLVTEKLPQSQTHSFLAKTSEVDEKFGQSESQESSTRNSLWHRLSLHRSIRGVENMLALICNFKVNLSGFFFACFSFRARSITFNAVSKKNFSLVPNKSSETVFKNLFYMSKETLIVSNLTVNMTVETNLLSCHDLRLSGRV